LLAGLTTPPSSSAAISVYNTGKGKGVVYRLIGALQALRSFTGYRLTGMSAVPGSTQLTLHLQSPAAAAAAQQAAEAAAAKTTADANVWLEHRVSLTTIKYIERTTVV
jgi:hypothetical protein